MFLINTKKVLPKNPMSIAALTSLLADSNMVRRHAADGAGTVGGGSVWCDDKELRRRAIFESVTYTMGWWSRLAEKQKSMNYDGPEGEDVKDGEIARTKDVGRSGLAQNRIFAVDADPVGAA